MLYDIFDLSLRAKVKPADFRPYPRPWVKARSRSRLTAREARRILRK